MVCLEEFLRCRAVASVGAFRQLERLRLSVHNEIHRDRFHRVGNGLEFSVQQVNRDRFFVVVKDDFGVELMAAADFEHMSSVRTLVLILMAALSVIVRIGRLGRRGRLFAAVGTR